MERLSTRLQGHCVLIVCDGAIAGGLVVGSRALPRPGSRARHAPIPWASRVPSLPPQPSPSPSPSPLLPLPQPPPPPPPLHRRLGGCRGRGGGQPCGWPFAGMRAPASGQPSASLCCCCSCCCCCCCICPTVALLLPCCCPAVALSTPNPAAPGICRVPALTPPPRPLPRPLQASANGPKQYARGKLAYRGATQVAATPGATIITDEQLQGDWLACRSLPLLLQACCHAVATRVGRMALMLPLGERCRPICLLANGAACSCPSPPLQPPWRS
jgi:hypothetical protein